MRNFTFTYLFLSLTYLAAWGILYSLRKDIRKEMFLLSLTFAIAGPLADMIYFNDYWKPITFSGSFFSIEAMLYGFAMGGIGSVVYDFVSGNKGYKSYKDLNDKEKLKFIGILGLCGLIFIFCYYLAGINSFISSIFGLGIPSMLMWFLKPDFIRNSILTGLLLVIISIPLYVLVDLVYPGWVNEFWYFKNMPDVRLLALPIDDLVWYFLLGCFIGPLYEFIRIKRLKIILH